LLRWRLAAGLLLFALIGLPLALPLASLLFEPRAWLVWTDSARLHLLLRNSSLLLAGTLALALPVGVVAGILFYRTNLPGRRFYRWVVLLTLFIPLPLFASAWQAILGSGGLWPTALWNPPRDLEVSGSGAVWTPWGQGLVSAVLIHALAALPWVTLFVGLGLRGVDPALEEDALTAAGPWRVLLRVSLPGARVALAAAALWVALQTSTEITVTDVMQVRTFSEEVYTQINAQDPSTDSGDGQSRALAVALPVTLAAAALVFFLTRRWERTLPAGVSALREPPTFALGRWRWFWAALALVGVMLYLCPPLLALLWRAGSQVDPPGWSSAVLLREMNLVSKAEGHILFGAILAAVCAGLLTMGLALLACWTALDSPSFRAGVMVLMALAWAWPGPIVGLGLKALIVGLVEGTNSRLLDGLLWQGPSLLPLIWVDLIRFFPCAVALLWPVVRLAPRDLRDAARVDGARPLQELLWVVAPLVAAALVRSALAVAVLSLGELSAGKMVSTAAQPSYAQTIFSEMHFGVTNHLAARCLMLLLVVAVGAIGLALWTSITGRRKGWL
jgi:iron(III) transport system permease protein